MAQNIELPHGAVAVPPFFESVQEALNGVANNVILERGTTTVVMRAASDHRRVNVAVAGALRRRSTDAVAAHPGGAAGTYKVWLTASANDFTGPDEAIDLTDYEVALAITASAAPTGPGIAHTRQIGTVEWDGSQITALRHEGLGVAGHGWEHRVRGRDRIPGAVMLEDVYDHPDTLLIDKGWWYGGGAFLEAGDWVVRNESGVEEPGGAIFHAQVDVDPGAMSEVVLGGPPGELWVAARFRWRPEQMTSGSAHDIWSVALFVDDVMVPGMGIHQLQAEHWVDRTLWSPVEIHGGYPEQNYVYAPGSDDSPVISHTFAEVGIRPTPIALDCPAGRHTIALAFSPSPAEESDIVSLEIDQLKVWVWTA